MRIISCVLIAIALATACHKPTAEMKTIVDFMPLHDGNYWHYETFAVFDTGDTLFLDSASLTVKNDFSRDIPQCYLVEMCLGDTCNLLSVRSTADRFGNAIIERDDFEETYFINHFLDTLYLANENIANRTLHEHKHANLKRLFKKKESVWDYSEGSYFTSNHKRNVHYKFRKYNDTLTVPAGTYTEQLLKGEIAEFTENNDTLKLEVFYKENLGKLKEIHFFPNQNMTIICQLVDFEIAE